MHGRGPSAPRILTIRVVETTEARPSLIFSVSTRHTSANYCTAHTCRGPPREFIHARPGYYYVYGTISTGHALYLGFVAISACVRPKTPPPPPPFVLTVFLTCYERGGEGGVVKRERQRGRRRKTMPGEERRAGELRKVQR